MTTPCQRRQTRERHARPRPRAMPLLRFRATTSSADGQKTCRHQHCATPRLHAGFAPCFGAHRICFGQWPAIYIPAYRRRLAGQRVINSLARVSAMHIAASRDSTLLVTKSPAQARHGRHSTDAQRRRYAFHARSPHAQCRRLPPAATARLAATARASFVPALIS